MSSKEAPRPGLLKAALAGRIGNEDAARALAITVRLSFAKSPAGVQLVDLSSLIRPQSPLDDQRPALNSSAPPLLVGGPNYLALENLALRHQLAVYRRTIRQAEALRH